MSVVIESDTWPMRRARGLTFTSRFNALPYRLGISIPLIDAPDGGYPVFYVLDGDSLFGSASETARTQSLFGKSIEAALVVAIGYPVEDLRGLVHRRYRDLTTPSPPEQMEPTDLYFGAQNGGMDAFLSVIGDEIFPLISDRFAVDSQRRTIFGHSLGGLTALRALLTRPGMFDRVIASSPSLHWNDGAIRREIDDFITGSPINADRPALLMLVGGLETEERFPMVANAIDAAERLKPAVPSRLRALSLHVFDDENHESVIPAALSRAVRFAFARR
jgi:hypothetical protein